MIKMIMKRVYDLRVLIVYWVSMIWEVEEVTVLSKWRAIVLECLRVLEYLSMSPSKVSVIYYL